MRPNVNKLPINQNNYRFIPTAIISSFVLALYCLVSRKTHLLDSDCPRPACEITLRSGPIKSRPKPLLSCHQITPFNLFIRLLKSNMTAKEAAEYYQLVLNI